MTTVFQLVGAKPRPRDRSADRHSIESGSWHVVETARKGADRGANRFGENDCARCHDKDSPMLRLEERAEHCGPPILEFDFPLEAAL